MLRHEENHRKFLSHLDESAPAIWKIAQWLAGRGNSVRISPTRRAPDVSQWREYVDSGDLEISQRVEVKQLGIDFTSAKDWPYKPNFIVCEKNAWDRAEPKPFAFFYVSMSGTHLAFLLGNTSRFWTVKKRKDGRYDDIEQDFYFAPIELVKWVAFGTAPKNEPEEGNNGKL